MLRYCSVAWGKGKGNRHRLILASTNNNRKQQLLYRLQMTSHASQWLFFFFAQDFAELASLESTAVLRQWRSDFQVHGSRFIA